VALVKNQGLAGIPRPDAPGRCNSCTRIEKVATNLRSRRKILASAPSFWRLHRAESFEMARQLRTSYVIPKNG